MCVCVRVHVCLCVSALLLLTHISPLGTKVCGGELTDTHGNINSPGYPGNYPPNRDCYWTVSVPPGLLITFAFGDLSLEHHPDCGFDFLEVGGACYLT